MRNLAWGLATFGLAFFPFAAAAAAGNQVFNTSVVANSIPRALAHGWDGIREPFHLSVVVPAVLGSWVLAGIVAALRCRWWLGPVLGAVLGPVAGGLLYVANPYGHLEGPLTVPLSWLVAGTTGGLLSAFRRSLRS